MCSLFYPLHIQTFSPFQPHMVLWAWTNISKCTSGSSPSAHLSSEDHNPLKISAVTSTLFHRISSLKTIMAKKMITWAKRKANMKYLLGLYYVSSTSIQINTAELQKTFCYELPPSRWPQGEVRSQMTCSRQYLWKGGLTPAKVEPGHVTCPMSVPPTGHSSSHKEEEALTQMTPSPLMPVTTWETQWS